MENNVCWRLVESQEIYLTGWSELYPLLCWLPWYPSPANKKKPVKMKGKNNELQVSKDGEILTEKEKVAKKDATKNKHN